MAQSLKILGKISAIGFQTCINEFDVVIVDTNILIDSPECVLEISKYTKTIIPVECIDELNVLKGKSGELNNKVNFSLKMINELKSASNNYSLVALSRYVQRRLPDFSGIAVPQISDVDFKIIQYAKYLHSELLGTKILILSKDKELQAAASYFDCCCYVGDINSYYIPQK